MPDQADKAIPMPDAAMKLALERTSASYDRTLMSRIRTAISLITFGFAIYKFFQIELQRGGGAGDRAIGPREFSLIMVGAGLLAMALGIVDHWLNKRALRARDPRVHAPSYSPRSFLPLDCWPCWQSFSANSVGSRATRGFRRAQDSLTPDPTELCLF